MQRFTFAIALAALVAVFLLWFTSNGKDAVTHGAAQQQVQAPPATSGEQGEGEEGIEVAVFMGRIQTYHQKLWAAGEAKNTDLAAFYLHEMEEAMESIADAHVIEDGVDVSAQMRVYGLDMVESFEARLRKDGIAAMHADGAVLANACNSCHMACGYPFIKVQVPTSVSYPDQVFTPVK